MAEGSELHTAGIVPDVLDAFKPDGTRLSVAYGGKPLKSGSEMTPQQASAEPQVALEPAGNMYTLMMVDPDAPSPGDPKMREFLHWIVADVQTDAASGRTLVPYMGPAPPKGKHRYVFLAYLQTGGAKLAEEPWPEDAQRGKFKAHRWATKHALQGPVAADFFYSSA